MSLLLSPRAIGSGWSAVKPGDLATITTQWLRFYEDYKRWEPLPLAVVGLPCRMGNHWRIPITKRAKLNALWAARANLFKRYILRKTS